MTYLRLPYDDAATTAEMAADCVTVGRALGLPAQRVLAPVPTRPTVVVPDDLADRAAGVELGPG